MSSHMFLKTCLADTLLIAAIAVPVFGAGCERQSEPPVQPRSEVARPAAPAGEIAAFEVAEAQDAGAPSDTPTTSRAGDAALTARVKTALLADQEVKGRAIDVDTKDAEVTLKGELENDAQVRRAVGVARDVEGVRNVVNRLTVKNEDKAARSTQS